LLRLSIVYPIIFLCSVISVSLPVAAQGPSVCFYEDADFQGFEFCGGGVRNLPPGINDTFSSVRISPGLAVTMCEHADFGGRCITLRHSVRNFAYLDGGFWNDVVSSFYVSPLN
jgi:hypothetical protein